MTATAQLVFVAAPTTAPTVTLSLSQPGLVKVLAESFSLGAPQFEGDPMSGMGGLGTREVEFTLQVTGTYQEAAAVLQKVARQLSRPSPSSSMGGRSWLMFRWSTSDDPVFLRILPSSLEPLDWRQSGAGVWEMPVSAVCEAGLYGAPESGQVTINNDPVAGTNPLFWRIGTGVKGDLPTPLFITTGAQTDLGGRGLLVGSSALRDGLTQTAPVIVQLPPASGVTLSGLTAGSGDAAMSGGNYWRRTSTGGTAQTANAQWNAGIYLLAGALVGDYRVMLRFRTSAPGVEWSVTLSQFDNTSASRPGDPSTTHSTFAGWLDLGVFRWPLGAGSVDTAFGTTPVSAGTRIKLDLSLPAGSVAGDTFDFDCLMFVPAGLDQAGSNTMAFVSVPSSVGSTSASLVLDGAGDQAYLTNSGGQIGTLGFPSFIGGLPVVVPDCDNSLTWLRAVSVGFSAATDSLAATTVLNWTYWPRYLYVRPATS